MEILAEKRLISGKKVKRLRAEGFIPAVIYSKDSSLGKKDVELISVNLKDFLSAYSTVGSSTILKVKVGDTVFQTLVSDIQKNPVTLDVVHVSFFEVDLSEKVTRMVPVEVVNEENCELVGSGEGLIITILNEIEVECLPNDIPSVFEIDASKLKEIGDVLTVEESVKVDKEKVEIKTPLDEAVIKLDYAEQLEVEEEEVSVDDVEVTTEKANVEGEEGDEGEKEKDSSKSDENKNKEE